jgi:glycosyltransferase involved in cell wall biosynthesis
MNKDDPKISVIVATKDRCNSISSCLEAIENSFLFANYLNGEIIVVDNNSQDQTSQIVRSFLSKSKIEVKLIFESKVGVSSARNKGIKSCSGELIIFTDDDCHLSESYISEALKYYHADHTKTIRSGSVLLGDQKDLPITIKKVEKKKTWLRPSTLKEEGDILGSSLIGCNIMTTLEVLNSIGLFDELLGGGSPCKAAEDTDYFYRAYLKFITLEIVPDLVVYHFHGRQNKADATKLLGNYSIGNGALILKYLYIYPNFSRHLYWSFKKLLKSIIFPVKNNADYNLSPTKDFLLQIKGVYLYFCHSKRKRR